MLLLIQTWRPLDLFPNADRSGFLWPMRVWDYAYYLSISQHWYPEGEVVRQYAFFPLWPAVLAVGERTIGAATLGTIVTFAATAAVFLSVALANPIASPRRTAIALACMPTSYVLLLVYPDALALAAAIGAAVLASRQRWGAATALGLVAALARPTGFLIAIVLFYFARQSRGKLRWASVLAPPLAFVGVMTYFWRRSGELFAFTNATDWARGHPWELPLSPFTSPAMFWEGILATFAIALCVLAWRSPLTRVWPVYATAVLAMSLGSGTAWGIGRHMFVAFPIVWAAAAQSLRLRMWLVAATGAGLSIAQAMAILAHAP